MRKIAIIFHCLFLPILPANTAISQEIFGAKIASPGNWRKRNTLGLLSIEETTRIWQRRRRGWAKGILEKKNLHMKNDDVDQTDVVVAEKEDVGKDTPPCLSSGWGSLLPPATTHQKQKASVQWRPWTEERQKEIGKDLNHNSTECPSPPVFASTSPPLTTPKPPGSSPSSPRLPALPP